MATASIPEKRKKVGIFDCLSYAAGDFGCNMSFALAGTYFTLFYTQYMGINSLVFAAVLVVLKVWDGINDPLLGGLIDAAKVDHWKRGKYKTFIYYGSFGLAIAAALCFLPFPQAPQIAKIMLCLFGYIMWDAFYTIVNVPYGSMLAAITNVPSERASLSAWRSLGALVAQMGVAAILPSLLYDANNNIMGGKLFVTALIMGVIALISIQFMCHTTIERVQVPPSTKKDGFNFLRAIVDFMKNRPAVGATLPTVAMYLGMYGAATATTVMFQAYFGDMRLSGLTTMCMTMPMFLFMPFLKKIVGRFGKQEASSACMLLGVLATFGMIVLPITPDATGMVIFFVCILLYGLGMGVFMCVGNALVADAIDYQEWSTGRREDNTIYAMQSFFRKIAQGIGPSIGLVLMVAFGYNEALGAAQPYEIALNMRYLTAAMYFFSAVLQFISLKFIYNLDKNTVEKMTEELNAKHAAELAQANQ